MTKTLKIAGNLSLPLDVVTQVVAVLAKRRSGKSFFARRFTEQLHACGQQVVVVDPKGDWWGLLSSADGKGPGLPFVIIGGERGHLPLEASGGEVVAKLVAEERVSALLDLSLLRKHEVATFMAVFLETLYRLKAAERFRTPVMLVVDEADAIAPQKPQPNEARMLGAAEDIVRRGGQRGIGCMLVTQRTAVLAKNVLTQAQILVALRTISPQDLAAMNAWVDVHGTPAERKTLIDSLPSLPVGDAWVWSPGWPTGAGIFRRIHTLPISTYDSGATPKPGKKRAEPKRVADVDLDKVRAQMIKTIDRAKADDPKELRKQMAALKAELAKAQKPVATAPTAAELVEATKCHARGEKLKDQNAQLFDLASGLLEGLQNVLGPARQRLALLRKGTPSARAVVATMAVPPRPVPVKPPPAPRAAETPKGAGGSVGGGERAILIAAAQAVTGATREQLSILTGYKRSTRDAYIQRLRAKGYVDERGGLIHATEAGITELGPDYEPLPTGDALLQHWLEKLPEGERMVLRYVAAQYPDRAQRDAISEATGYKRSTRDAYLQRLSARRLVTADRDGVTASEELFG